MSEENSDGFHENGSKGAKYCRDFQRGVCRRQQCKYRHDTNPVPYDTSKVNFCHDFQNSTCVRVNCKFLHYSVADEDYFKRMGKLPRPIESATKDIEKGGPACKDFMQGICRRYDCKFRHITISEYELENGRQPVDKPRQNVRYDVAPHTNSDWNTNRDYVQPSEQNSGQPLWNRERIEPTRGYSSIAPSYAVLDYRYDDSFVNEVRYIRNTDNSDTLYERRPVHRGINREYELVRVNGFEYQPPTKKRFYQREENGRNGELFYSRTLTLEDENIILRKELDDLKRQLSDLAATNEFLLEQNAALRCPGSVTAVTLPAVTITNTSVHQSQPQTQMIRTVTASVATVPVSIAAVSMAPVQVAAPIVSMSTPQTQIIGTITNSQPLLANSSQAQQIAALAQHTLAAASSGASTQIISSTQQQILAGSTQLAMATGQAQTQQILTPIGLKCATAGQQLAASLAAINTSQALAMSNASQPIISYPIMTQSILPH